MKFNFGNAFKIPQAPGITPEEGGIIVKLAQVVRARGLGMPASFLVESTRPMHGVGSNTVRFFAPLLEVVLTPPQVERCSGILENPTAMEKLAELLNEENSEKREQLEKKLLSGVKHGEKTA